MKKSFARSSVVTISLILLLLLPVLLTACARRPITPSTPTQGSTAPTTLPAPTQTEPETTTIPVPTQTGPETTTLPLLSQMTEEECIAFIKANGIEIPEGLEKGENFGAFIKRIITKVENEPDHRFSYSYYPTHKMANDIAALVNEYYGRNTEATGPGA